MRALGGCGRAGRGRRPSPRPSTGRYGGPQPPAPGRAGPGLLLPGPGPLPPPLGHLATYSSGNLLPRANWKKRPHLGRSLCIRRSVRMRITVFIMYMCPCIYQYIYVFIYLLHTRVCVYVRKAEYSPAGAQGVPGQ